MTMNNLAAAQVVVVEVERFSKLGKSRLRHNQQQKALEAFRHAYHLSQVLGHHGYMQRACAFNLGAVFVSLGNFSEGLTYLKQAEPSKGSHDGRSSGDLFFNFALAYEGLGNWRDTKDYYFKALKEYQSEKDNTSMEAKTISRLGKVCVAFGQFEEAESCLRQLIQVYAKLGDRMKKLRAQVELASVYLQLNDVDKAETTADGCFRAIQDLELSNEIVAVLTELGLVFSQMHKYDDALQCFQRGLTVVSEQKLELKHNAVLYQNLGVTYNYLQQYKDALHYHQAAATVHAELKNRRSQGHCFMNLGFAYSQLNDLNHAREYFLHSLQAAKDCGDRKSEWQSLEALATVAYREADLKQSQNYYKLALKVLSKSQEVADAAVHERIVGKLTSVIQVQANGSAQPAGDVKQMVKRKSEITTVVDTDKRQEPVEVRKQRKVPRAEKQGSVIAIRKDGHIKYLRVRRSGTLQKFNKVALGLDSNMSPVPAGMYASVGAFNKEDLVYSAYTTEASDQEDISEEDVTDKAHQEESQSSLVRKSGNGEAESEKMDQSDSEEDQMKQVLQAMKDVVHQGDGVTTWRTNSSLEELHTVEDEPDSEDEADTDTDESTEDEDDDIHSKRRLPPIPESMVQSTFADTLQTYEVPAARKVQPQTPSEDKQALTQTEYTEEESSAFDNRIYETIATLKTLGNTTTDGHEKHDNTDTERHEKQPSGNESKDKVVKLPLGVRDKVEFKTFQTDLKTRQQPEAKADNERPVNRRSRACVLM